MSEIGQVSRAEPIERPILGMGVGRMVAVATALASIMPLVVLHRYADARIARWAATTAGSPEVGFWKSVAVAGQPLTWFVVATVGFGAAAAFNWANTARWTGMLALAVMWAGLANIAVVGHAKGAATAAAVATVLSLWVPRAWPAWASLACLVAVAQMIVRGTSGTSTALCGMLGALGVLLVEYGWHHAAPDTPPRRGARFRT